MAVGQTEGHSFKRKGGVLQSEFEILRVPIQCKHLGVGDKCPISDMETGEMKNIRTIQTRQNNTSQVDFQSKLMSRRPDQLYWKLHFTLTVTFQTF